MAHPERRGQGEDLAPDVAQPDHPEDAAGAAGSQVIPLHGPPTRARQAIFDQHSQTEREAVGNDAGCDRSPHAARGDREDDVVLGTGVDIDAVVADAETGDEGQTIGSPKRRGGDPGGQDQQRVIVAESVARRSRARWT